MACNKLALMMAMAAFYCGGFEANALEFPEKCKNDELCEIKPEAYDNLQNDIDEKFLFIKERGWYLENKEIELSDTPIYNNDKNELNCRSITKVSKPYSVTKNDTTKAVVQTKFYEQKFLVTKCLSRDSPGNNDGDQCFGDLTSANHGTCKTRYTSISLYVYNDQSKEIKLISTELPVSCSCILPSL